MRPKAIRRFGGSACFVKSCVFVAWELEILLETLSHLAIARAAALLKGCSAYSIAHEARAARGIGMDMRRVTGTGHWPLATEARTRGAWSKLTAYSRVACC